MVAIAPQHPVSPSPASSAADAPAGASRAQVIASLREHIARVAPVRTLPLGLPTGIPALEGATGGWARPGVSLILGPPGSGRLRAVMPALRRLTCSGRRVAVVDAGGWLHPPGLDGVLLDNLLIVRPGATRVAWAAEQLCRCGVLPLVVVLDPPELGRGGRRLQGAAEEGNTAVVVISELAQRRLPARLRMMAGQDPAGRTAVLLQRGGRGRPERWIQLAPPDAQP